MADTSKLVSFQTHHPSFNAILGSSPSITLLAEDSNNVSSFHEACIYHKPSNSVIVTSGQIAVAPGVQSPDTANKTVKLYRIYDTSPATVEDITPQDLKTSMLNGGVNYGPNSILLCAQGSKNTSLPEGIVEMELPPPHSDSAAINSTPFKSLVSTFHGRPFNSVNDVIVHPQDQSIWFTDPCYGYHQNIRPAPVLPVQVYRFDPKDSSIRVVADGFTRCNGLCFSPDLKTIYITDTGGLHGAADVPMDKTGPSHIFAFDVLTTSTGGTFLANRRLFAFADGFCPDGIKCDLQGNVYSGCQDGVEVWNPDGVLIGRILVKGGVANFCFGENGAVYMCNETRFWKAQLGDHIKGALLGL